MIKLRVKRIKQNKEQLLKNEILVNTILKEANLFCPNSVRIKFAIYHIYNIYQNVLKYQLYTTSDSFKIS